MDMRLRPESSVSLAMNSWGEIEFACDGDGPVIHRTPEELGIPRTIAAPRPAEKSAVEIRAERAEAEKLRRAVEQRRKTLCAQKNFRAKVARNEEREGAEVTANELKQKVLAEPDLPTKELAAKTGASPSQIYNWRYEAKKKAGLIAPHVPKKAKPASKDLQHVSIDPQRPGSASALIDALAKRDAASATAVHLEFTEGEVAALIGRLSEAQRAVFLAAGVKAAILG